MRPTNDYSRRLPSHYCGECSQVVFPDDLLCPMCNAAPDGEWPSIQDGHDSWLGRVLDGRYVITKRIGQGAMGTVYKADSLGITRQFAVKIINFKEGASGLDATQVRARLHREIEAIGKLRNPHVVPFYEVLEIFDHFVGVVMDYVEGVTLEEMVLTQGPFEPRRAIQILRQVANGVHEAHEAGMIHRDLKPENIMIEVLPAGDDFAHVLDFGIVRMDDGVSMTKGFLGTPLYASPEQAMAGAIDRRSDVYSLGALVFFMLTSHAPFESDNVYEILQSHVRRPAPSLAEIFGKPFPVALESLVGDMLAKNPEQRPQTLADVINRVDRMLRFGELDELVPDSIDILTPVGSTHLGVHNTDVGLDEESSSVFESSEHDRTGPKAAIFRGGSRTGTKRMIEAQRQHKPSGFDRIYEGNTGATTLGLSIGGDIGRGAAAHNGNLVVQSSDGISLARDGHISSLGTLPDITALGISAGAALAGASDGHIHELTAHGPLSLFQDVRRAPITALAMAIDDTHWLAGSDSGRIYKCTPSAGKKVWTRICDGPAIAALALDGTAKTFAVARKHGEIEVAYVTNPKQPFARFSVDGEVRSVCLSDDGRLLAVLFDDDSVSVHLVDNGQVVHRLRDEKNFIFALGFIGEELLGYFQLDSKMYARQLDRAENVR